MTTNPNPPEITYPCEVPIKAMGLMHDNFVAVIVEIVGRHVPRVNTGMVTTRTNGKYVSVTVNITAGSRAQLEAIYLDLKDCDQVLMTL
ncbi:MAG: DUF493 domain-containing protein [Gammaproteobacteria bacterium]|nr:DUF493 domain-containing protein [Gammaproteobacteria bacterium]